MSTREWLIPALLTAALVACSPAPGPSREWTPADHDKADQPGANRGGRVKQRKEVSDEPELMALTWTKNCERCHGVLGKGDGPMGPSVGAPDLTRPDFLANATDDQIRATIVNGKGKMPAFGQFSERVVGILIKRIRAQGQP
jgi:mono/diheme cytochrome c family protein